jgi:hypothetical protein
MSKKNEKILLGLLVTLTAAFGSFQLYEKTSKFREKEKITDLHQQLGIDKPSEWDFIIPEEEFQKIHDHNFAVILALKFGTVIYKDIDGKIITSNDDIMITANKVVRPWNYKEAGAAAPVTHKHPKRPKCQQGTGLKDRNVMYLYYYGIEYTDAKVKNTPNEDKLCSIIVSTGMEGELGVEDGLEESMRSHLKNRRKQERIEELHVLNSREVPQKYLELLNKYKRGVGVLLHITC